MLGTQSGDLELLSLSSSERVAVIPAAHAKSVWAMAPAPDASGFVTASADGFVKVRWGREGGGGDVEGEDEVKEREKERGAGERASLSWGG